MNAAKTPEERIKAALNTAQSWGSSDGDHHKMWVIDQMVRELLGCPLAQFTAKDYKGVEYTYEGLGESAEYTAWVAEHNQGEYGPYTYEWDKGIAP